MNSTRNEKTLKRFGKHLEKLRLDRNLSLRKLADIADIDFSQVHRIEKGQTNPSLTMVLALAESLNVSISELLEF